MAFAHFCLWVTFWSSLRYFEHLHHCYICYGELQSMVVDVVIVSVLKGYELQPCTTTNLIDKYVCYDRSANGSHVSFSLKLLIFCDIIIFKSGQLITPQWSLSVHVKKKSCVSFTWNLKLGMIKISEEGMSKAKNRGKARTLALAMLRIERKCSWTKLKVLFQQTHKR